MVDGVTYLPLLYTGSRETALPHTAPPRLRGFVVDDGNSLAIAATEALLENSSTAATDDSCQHRVAHASEVRPSIILLQGPSGVGKTHLAHALATHWRNAHVGARVVVATGADFARRYPSELSTGPNTLEDAVAAEKSYAPSGGWKAISLFVLDNIDELLGKPTAQQQLCAALDELVAHGGRAILTCRAKPTADERFDRRLSSRLSAGLVASLGRLTRIGRRAVLGELALARGLTIPTTTLDQLSAHLPGTVRDLTGAIARLDLLSRSTGQPLDDSLVAEFIESLGKDAITLKSITQRVAEHFRVKTSELRGPARRKEVVAARSVAIHLSRRLTGESLQSIGRHFGGRDHATVIYNLDKVAAELASGVAETAQAVARIAEALEADADRMTLE